MNVIEKLKFQFCYILALLLCVSSIYSLNNKDAKHVLQCQTDYLNKYLVDYRDDVISSEELSEDCKSYLRVLDNKKLKNEVLALKIEAPDFWDRILDYSITINLSLSACISKDLFTLAKKTEGRVKKQPNAKSALLEVLSKNKDMIMFLKRNSGGFIKSFKRILKGRGRKIGLTMIVSFSAAVLVYCLYKNFGGGFGGTGGDGFVDGTDNCPICLSVLGWDVRILGRCGHRFHNGCIDGWINQNYYNPTCPNCRAPIL